MKNPSEHKLNILNDGFTITDNIFSVAEIDAIAEAIEGTIHTKQGSDKVNNLYAIRRFLKEVPAVFSLIFTEKLNNFIKELFGENHFIIKSIYFDKPEGSNWFVSYHQDLTISVSGRADIPGFGPWSVKKDQYAVKPPLNILEHNFTIRIHLDDTAESNGALRVIPGSHRKGEYRPEHIDWQIEKEEICKVPKGGVMIMKPLLLHASSRSVNGTQRRVIHIEFSNQQLPEPLVWSELMMLTV